MALINPGDSMTHVMDNVLNPVINDANKYTEDLATVGNKYIVDSRKIPFTDNVGDSVTLSVVGMDPDEKVVRAVVRYYNAGDQYDYFYPCPSVTYDPVTQMLTATFGRTVTAGDLFVEFWKRYDKETPTIELITGKTEMHKVRSEILNPAIERIKDLTQDVVHTGTKLNVDHRVWRDIALTSTSMNATIASVNTDEYIPRAMFRYIDPATGKTKHEPAVFCRFLRRTKRLNVFSKAVIGGRGDLLIEFWKYNTVVPQNNISEIQEGGSLSNIRQNSINQSLSQMDAHTQIVTNQAGMFKNTIDYRSHDFDADDGHEEGLHIELDPAVSPVRSAIMVENGTCHPCNDFTYDRNSNKLLHNIVEHRKGEMFVEYWKDL